MCKSIILTVSLGLTLPAVGQSDVPGSKDYPGISRMAGYTISAYKEAPYDTAVFMSKEGEQRIPGHYIRITYTLRNPDEPANPQDVVRFYLNATSFVGGTVMSESAGDGGKSRNVTIRFVKENLEPVWILVEAGPLSHTLTIMEQRGKPLEASLFNAETMAHDLSVSGKVLIYGIAFDPGKSNLPAGADSTLAEMARLLKSNSSRYFVVAHTDTAGDAAANVKLSQARAQAVVDTLVTKYGIPTNRLTAFGAGPYAPVASNKNETGRAKNRRIELVEAI